MAAELSIVVPTLDAEAVLPACLAALFEGLHAGLIRELVVADGGSQDATRAIAEEAGGVLVESGPSRGARAHAGCMAARGEWLLVLDPSAVLEPGWTEAVAAQIADGRPGCFRLAFRAGGAGPALAAGLANLALRLGGRLHRGQGLLLRRARYARTAGFSGLPGREAAFLSELGRPVMMPARAVLPAPSPDPDRRPAICGTPMAARR